MNEIVHDFVKLVESNKGVNTKEEMIKIVGKNFHVVNDGRAAEHNSASAALVRARNKRNGTIQW